MATKKQQKNSQPVWAKVLSLFFQAVAVFALIGLVVFFGGKGSGKSKDVSLSAIASQVQKGEIQKIEVRGAQVTATLSDGTVERSKKEAESSFTDTLSKYGVTGEQLSDVELSVERESGFVFWLLNLLPIIIPILFFGFLIWLMTGQMRGANGGGMKVFSFGQSKARVSLPGADKKQVTFKDVAGNIEAKKELEEIVEFLRTPKKFFDIGAKIPKGVLLMGAPGTGKTLMARAVAGEAGVPFFHLSGSEFVEMFVGVGASRVRDLFDQAKKLSPAIIFIDEIDAVGRTRGAGYGGGNDEREQTLNQILVEMDGFQPTEKVIVIAATNRGDVLDPALLRPGRFDRRVMLDTPDRKDRLEILKIHASEKPLASDVNLETIAVRTPGFSGADLESLMNEAAILAARKGLKEISQEHLLVSIEKVMIGPERSSHLHTHEERKIVAYHEAGHALLGTILPHVAPVHKVSIVARGHAGGYTLIPPDENKFPSRSQLLDTIVMSLGGRSAEKVAFNEITTGAETDLQSATRIARSMVMKWGMSDALGPIAFAQGHGGGFFGEGAQQQYSEEVEAKIDAEVSRIMKESETRAIELLEKHKSALDAVSQKLLEVETLEQEAYEALVSSHGIEPKRKK
jgi:cell division protease FtsH